MSNDANPIQPTGSTNRGPNGSGSYDNDENWRLLGGETWAHEATSATAEVMASMPVITAPVLGTSSEMTAEQMSGGNAASSG